MKSLTIKLTAPLQSYGNEANYEQRTTYAYPSKSAIIGMLGSALGITRDDKFNRINKLSEQLSFAVRLDQIGTTLTDLQNIAYASGMGKLKQSYRDYLQDAVFVVAIGGGNQVIDELVYALRHPHYQLSLGRRACTPSGPLEIEVYDNLNPVEALNNVAWQASKWYQQSQRVDHATLTIVADARLLPHHETFLMKDNVLSLSHYNREYDYRLVAETKMEVINPQAVGDTAMYDLFEAI